MGKEGYIGTPLLCLLLLLPVLQEAQFLPRFKPGRDEPPFSPAPAPVGQEAGGGRQRVHWEQWESNARQGTPPHLPPPADPR